MGILWGQYLFEDIFDLKGPYLIYTFIYGGKGWHNLTQTHRTEMVIEGKQQQKVSKDNFSAFLE